MQAAGHRKTRVGRVVSDKMEKTVIVTVEWSEQHALYRRVIKRRSRFKVHNEGNQAKLGDRVRIIETRPLSKDKRWSILTILTKGDVADIAPGEIDETKALAQEQPAGGAA
jgi:small subunit ribosomal protein S17